MWLLPQLSISACMQCNCFVITYRNQSSQAKHGLWLSWLQGVLTMPDIIAFLPALYSLTPDTPGAGGAGYSMEQDVPAPSSPFSAGEEAALQAAVVSALRVSQELCNCLLLTVLKTVPLGWRSALKPTRVSTCTRPSCHHLAGMPYICGVEHVRRRRTVMIVRLWVWSQAQLMWRHVCRGCLHACMVWLW